MEQQQDDNHQNRQLWPLAQPEDLEPLQPQKCPRCESVNTKFCYFNNYSLSQPRHFCRTCRRYWTQGGTLRNVPIGGSSRKGKRPKTSSSSSTGTDTYTDTGTGTSTGENPRSPPSESPWRQPQTIPATKNPPLRNREFGSGILSSAISPRNSYFSGSRFFSSVTTVQSLSQSQPFNHKPLNGGGGQFKRASNLAIFNGFNVPFPGSRQDQQQQIQQQNELFQMGNIDKNIEPLYPSNQILAQPNRPLGPWSQTLLIKNTAGPSNASIPNPNFMNTDQWLDLPDFDSPI